MSKQRGAKVSQMGALHELLCAQFTAMLNSGEEIGPQMMGVIVRFLKDNDISAVLESNEGLQGLVLNLPNFDAEEYEGLKLYKEA